MLDISRILLFSFAYAFSINAVKLGILHIYSNMPVYAEILIEFAHDFTFGIFIYASTLLIHRQRFRYVVLGLLTFIAIVIEYLAFHYQLVFRRLPSADILFYITELDQLSSSLSTNLPLTMLLVELLLTIALLLALLKYLSSGSSIFKNKRLLETAGCSVVIFSILVSVFPGVLEEKYKWSARHEILWLVQSYFLRENYDLDKLRLSSDQFDQYLEDIGLSGTAPSINPDYPLCRYSNTNNVANGKNLILLILEGVSENELYSTFEGQDLMPNLRKIAAENISITQAYAAGSKSAQALTAIFSGLPAHTSYNYLWTKPLLKFDGFPNILAEKGYRTAYFHGSDLSFEQQRTYLSRVGFDYIFEYNPDKKHQIYGWGYDDRTMFNELKSWINDQKNNNNKPYLASLFTLSTHDPYLLPDEWEPVLLEREKNLRSDTNWTLLTELEEVRIASYEAYHFLDHHLGKFYEWYLNHEKNNDTILLITGDHGSYLTDGEKQNTADAGLFRVPLIVAGLDDEHYEDYQKYAKQRIAGLHDIPATIMHLLGNKPHACNLGINLFMDESLWPAERLVYSVAGDTLEKIYIWKNKFAFVLDKSLGEFTSIDLSANSQSRKTAIHASDALQQKIDNLFKVNFYLLKKNKYFPRKDEITFSSPISGLKQPLFVSHRGNTNGTGNSQYENSKRAIESAINSGFNWVEIDVQITGDGIPILLHDPYIILPDGERLDLISTSYANLISVKGYEGLLTLEHALDLYASEINLLVEVKAPEHISDILHLGREVARLVTTYKAQNRIIVDSFSDEIISSIKKQCNCETGLDAPFKAMLDKPALEYIRSMNMDWVYLHYSVVTPEVIRAAHEAGLRVMAYTVNDISVIEDWLSTEMPDGIITDYLQVKEYFKQDNEPE